MKFCSICDNMYYIQIDKDNPNSLVYYCPKCNNQETILTEDNIVVSKKYVKKEQNAQLNINKYTKYDPTLPSAPNILCPNPDCKTNKGDDGTHKRKILYYRYDDTNMKFLYLCSTCDTSWKIENI